METFMLWPVRALFLAAAFAAAACSGDSGNSNCISNEDFFQKKVWIPVLQTSCVGCHSPGGQYTGQDFVLNGTGEAAAMAENMAVTEQIGLTEFNGVSLLLGKPTLQLPHEGGKWLSQGSKDYKNLEEFINRINNPVACVSSTGGNVYGVKMLSPANTARKAALQIAGRLPSDSEELQVRVNGAKSLNLLLDEMMTESYFYEWLMRQWNDVFMTDQYNPDDLGQDSTGLLDGTMFPDRRYYDEDPDGPYETELRYQTRYAVGTADLQLIAHVVQQNRPFTEIVTADYVMVNPFSVRAYGISDSRAYTDGTDPDTVSKGFFEGQIPGIPHAGLLTSMVIMDKYGSTNTNVNRARSRYIFKWFLATDVLKIADRPIDPTEVNLDHNPTLFNEDCTMCHFVMDPIAGLFKDFDNNGDYEYQEDWNADMQPPGFSTDEPLPAAYVDSPLQWLGARIAVDDRFALSVVQYTHEFLTGQAPLIIPTNTDDSNYENDLEAYSLQQTEYARLTNALKAAGYNYKELVKKIITGPYFRADNTDQTSTQGDVHGIGSARLIKPRDLHTKIRAIFGYDWRGNRLINPYDWRPLYGGHTSEARVAKRTREPNGIIASIQMRMANEMACTNASYDLSIPNRDERRFFPYVDRTDAPLTDSGFPNTTAVNNIKRNIQYLHRKLLGEDILLTGDEMARSYGLFLDVWRHGQDLISAAESDDSDDDDPWDHYGLTCGAWNNPITGDALPDEQRFWADENYVVHAWTSLMTYLLMNYRFFYQ